MELAIESTRQIVSLDGVPCRVWEGVTASGVRCTVYVHRVKVHKDDDCTEFERELMEQDAPRQTQGLPDATTR